VFLVFVMGSAALTVNASTRLLGPPSISNATPAPLADTCAGIIDDAGRQACHRQQSYELHDPLAADACSGASGECSHQEAQAHNPVEEQQLAVTQACNGNTDQQHRRICADMLTRVVGTQQKIASANIACVAADCSQAPPFCPGYDPRLPAPDSCPPATPRP
jgi:hypothetical protein